MADQDKPVADYLAAHGVEFSAVLVGETKRDDWQCDQWRIRVTKRGQSGGKVAALETDYFTGTGHRKPSKAWPRDPVAQKPTAASVLYSLLLDASGAGGNFLDWCDEYGYDSDSRKALATYEACCITRADVHKVFTSTERAELAAMLEDY